MALLWTGSRAEGRTVVWGFTYWKGVGLVCCSGIDFVFEMGFLCVAVVFLELAQ